MTDGSWGYTAGEGLKAVLGRENIDKMNRREGAMTPEQMREYILNAPEEKNVSYSDEARRFAKEVLLEADKDKEDFLDNSAEFANKVLRKSKENYDLTGFMFGWAFNAVRYILGSPPDRNPAIMTIGGG